MSAGGERADRRAVKALRAARRAIHRASVHMPREVDRGPLFDADALLHRYIERIEEGPLPPLKPGR